MIGPSLAVGSAAWRACMAGAWIGGFLRGTTAPDDVFEGLAALGAPVDGWLEVLAGLRAVGTEGVAVALPRPGDPRGVRLPPGPDVGGAVGWARGDGTRWLLAVAGRAWEVLDVPGSATAAASLEDADRHLRDAVVRAAHRLDARGPHPWGSGMPGEAEAMVDLWLASAPLPAQRRALASRGLRLLAAVESAPPAGVSLSDSSERADALRMVEPAARGAVEAAYSTQPQRG